MTNLPLRRRASPLPFALTRKRALSGYRKVRTDAPGIFKGSPPSQIEYIDTDRRIVDISCRPERTGTGTVRHYHGADESHRGRDRGIEANSTNGMGAAL